MSENQQPLTEEQAESAPVEPVDLPAGTDEAIDAVDLTEEQPEEEVDIDPADVHIFGMPRVGFHCTAFGVAGGYIVSGLLGMAGFNPPDATICAVVCAAIGYVIGRQLYKRDKAARDAAAAAKQTSGTGPTAE